MPEELTAQILEAPIKREDAIRSALALGSEILESLDDALATMDVPCQYCNETEEDEEEHEALANAGEDARHTQNCPVKLVMGALEQMGKEGKWWTNE